MFNLIPRNAEQQSWLKNASKALAEAEQAIGLLASLRPPNDADVAALQAEILVLRQQVEFLLRKQDSSKGRETSPIWTGMPVWPPQENER